MHASFMHCTAISLLVSRCVMSDQQNCQQEHDSSSPVSCSKTLRKVCLLLILIPVLIVVVFIAVWRPIFVTYFYRFTKLIVLCVVRDNQRFLDNELEAVNKEWRMYRLESRFGQDWCKEYAESRSNVTWLTALVNDKLIFASLVLGHSIRTFSCQKNMIALISDQVSKKMVKALQRVGWETRVVEELDCEWMEATLGGERNFDFFRKSRIKGTHTRFHAWKYTEFSKIIYTDADYMLMTNVDELFDLGDDFAAVPCGRPGVVDPFFNAGFLVFRPNMKHHEEMMKLWRELTAKDTCPHDQDLLNMYYSNKWKELPYTYNIRRHIYRPMKSFHFACCYPPKPWSAECRPNREEAYNFNSPILTFDDIAMVFWKNAYELLHKYELEDWWRSTEWFRPWQEFGNTTYADCLSNISVNPQR